MQIYFSVIYRTAPVAEAGEIVSLDWNNKTVLNKAKIWPYNPDLEDPNPRGNTRGGRGITNRDGQIIVASYHSLHIYDYNLNFQRKISHPLFVNLHEIKSTEDGCIWAAATGIDAALKLNIDAQQPLIESYWPREHTLLQKSLSLEPLSIDKESDNRGKFLSRQHAENESHTHLNDLVIINGDPFALLNKYGAVVNLVTGEIVINEPVGLRGAHNIVVDKDKHQLFINNTLQRAVHIYDLDTFSLIKVIALKDSPPILDLVKDEFMPASSLWTFLSKANRSIFRKLFDRIGLSKNIPAMPLFVRGMALLDEYVFIGISPASIIQFNWQTGQLVDIYQYSEDVKATIHGIQIIK